jgi:hypothetical protein
LQATQRKEEEEKGYPSNQVSAAAVASVSDEKWRPFSFYFILFFLVQGTGGSPTGPDP